MIPISLAIPAMLATGGAALAASVQVLEEGKALSSSLAEEFAESRACPKDYGDIEKLKELWNAYDVKPFPTDVSELIAVPLDASSTELEAHLPVSCGLAMNPDRWLRDTTYCKDSLDCFHQYNRDTFSKGGWHTLHRTNDSSPFVHGTDKDGNKSMHSGGHLGDVQYVPLGNGVFLDRTSSESGGYFYGLVLVPSKGNFRRVACKKSDWLKQNQSLLQRNEIRDGQAAIRRLFMQGSALESVRKLMAFIDKNKDLMPESALERMRRDAKHLLAVVDGKEGLAGFKMGQNPCPGDAGVTEHGGGKRLGGGGAPVHESKISGASVKR